jgi:hypothetical protein
MNSIVEPELQKPEPFCHSGTVTGMHSDSGSGAGIGFGSNIIFNTKIKKAKK